MPHFLDQLPSRRLSLSYFSFILSAPAENMYHVRLNWKSKFGRFVGFRYRANIDLLLTHYGMCTRDQVMFISKATSIHVRMIPVGFLFIALSSLIMHTFFVQYIAHPKYIYIHIYIYIYHSSNVTEWIILKTIFTRMDVSCTLLRSMSAI